MKVDMAKSGAPGQLQVEIAANELTVTRPIARSPQAFFLGIGFGYYFWFLCISLVGQGIVAHRLAGRPALEKTDMVASLSLFAFPLLGCLVFLWVVGRWMRAMPGGLEMLRCTRETIEVTTFRLGRIRRRQSFGIGEVKQFEIAAPGRSRRGTIAGFRFIVRGKVVICLSGLKIAEAHTILLEMSRLGVDTVYDPALPVAADDEASGRSR